MLVHLSIVEDVFDLSGRGSVVVAPGIPRSPDWQVRVGDTIRMRRPDGTEADTDIRGIEMTSPPSPLGWAIMLGVGLTKADVPIGTELLVDAAHFRPASASAD
jgi:hypothetical protein